MKNLLKNVLGIVIIVFLFIIILAMGLHLNQSSDFVEKMLPLFK